MNKDTAVLKNRLPKIFLIAIFLLSSRKLFSFGSFQVPVSFLLIYFFILLYFTKIKIDTKRIIVFPIFLTIFIVSNIFGIQKNLVEALNTNLQFIVLYTPLLFYLELDEKSHFDIIKTFQYAAVIACIYGAIQTLCRYFLGIGDPLSSLGIKFISGYNELNQILGMDQIIPIKFKVNSVFSEASIFSQFLAIAIIYEVLYFKNKLRLVLFIFFMLTTLSGTGIMILLIYILVKMFSVLDIRKMKARYIVISLSVLASICILTYVVPDLKKYYLNRLSEFDSPTSSAHIRFVEPLKITEDALSRNLYTGYGAGAHSLIKSVSKIQYYKSDPNSYHFILIDYGILGLISFLVYILCNVNNVSKIERNNYLIYLIFLVTGMYALTYVPTIFIFIFMLRNRDLHKEYGIRRKEVALAQYNI